MSMPRCSKFWSNFRVFPRKTPNFGITGILTKTLGKAFALASIKCKTKVSWWSCSHTKGWGNLASILPL